MTTPLARIFSLACDKDLLSVARSFFSVCFVRAGRRPRSTSAVVCGCEMMITSRDTVETKTTTTTNRAVQHRPRRGMHARMAAASSAWKKNT
jgi:hypothetical protein